MKLRVQDVEFGYSSSPTIRDVTFGVEAGDLLGIVGPNGVGKTTLLKCLNRILQPRRGAVLLDGDDLTTMARTAVARRVGYVAQRSVASRMTVYDMVLLGRIPRIGWGVGSDDLRVADAVIELLGLGELALRYADELSGGELQLVQIARALVQEPLVMLLDEPTSNLDINNQHRLMSTIQQVVRSNAIAAIMTIHDVNLAIRYANKFILMRDGAVFAAGGREVITPAAMRAVFSIEVHVGEVSGIPFLVPL